MSSTPSESGPRATRSPTNTRRSPLENATASRSAASSLAHPCTSPTMTVRTAPPPPPTMRQGRPTVECLNPRQRLATNQALGLDPPHLFVVELGTLRNH